MTRIEESSLARGVLFGAVIPCRSSGTRGLTVRVLPHHEDLGHPHETGLIAWAASSGTDEPDPDA